MTADTNSNVVDQTDLDGNFSPPQAPAYRRDSHGSSEPVTEDQIVQLLREIMVDELSAVRCEIDELRKGGWKVAVGPFVQVLDPVTQNDHERIRQEITKRIEGKTGDAVLALLTANGSGDAVLPSMNGALVNATTNTISAAVEPFQPAFVKNLQPSTLDIPSASTTITFSWDFLTTIFNGAIEHSPGLYYIHKHAGGSLIPGRTFYAIQGEHEPFLPTKPGEHGAKMTAFFNPDPPAEGEETSYEDVPLFISHVSGKYKYYGTYSQNRWSDKLGHDIQAVHVPASIKEYWAKELANPARPAWVTECLMKHLFPKPEYEGPMPAGTPDGSMSVKLTEEEEQKSARRMKRAMTDYFEELRLWEKEASTKVGLMKKEDLIKSFDKADADENPGLRLQWEYLECKEWDKGFYEMLVKSQAEHSLRR